MDSNYFDTKYVRAAVDAGGQRRIIGGAWEEIGQLQFEFLKSQGLKSEHKLLDIGCGSLRGGVHFVGYLQPGNYFGTDVNESLLAAGYEVEIEKAGLRDRLPRQNLMCIGDFNVDSLSVSFDFALAQSVFTHLTFNRIRQCPERFVHKTRPGASFYATFFELPEGAPAYVPRRHSPGDIVTHDVSDPYHYRLSDLRHAAAGLPWEVRYFGDWGHPRDQQMVAFIRSCSEDMVR